MASKAVEHEIWFVHTERYVGKILFVRAGHELSLQYHERKDETSYLLSGRLSLTQEPGGARTVREVGPGEAWHNPPGLVHTIAALEDSTVLEVSTPDLDDVVRLEDPYGRTGTALRSSPVGRGR